MEDTKKTEVVQEEASAAEGTTGTLDPKEVICDSLRKTGREGIDSLIRYMEESGFFTAPASGGNHSSGTGGLAEHSMNVMFMAQKLSVSLYGAKNLTDEMRNSIVIAALLHDLGKCGDFGKQMYVPNMIQDGRLTKANPEQKYKQSENKPWKRNPALLPLDHATRSIKLATLFIDLTEEEEFAIRYHDGLYETANYGVKGHETELYMILHWADLWSSRVLEGNAGEDCEN